jgi:hypothetical protein
VHTKKTPYTLTIHHWGRVLKGPYNTRGINGGRVSDSGSDVVALAQGRVTQEQDHGRVAVLLGEQNPIGCDAVLGRGRGASERHHKTVEERKRETRLRRQ